MGMKALAILLPALLVPGLALAQTAVWPFGAGAHGASRWSAEATSQPAEDPRDVSTAPAAVRDLDESQVRDRFGTPDLVRAEASGSLWTYRKSGCALVLAFGKGADGRLRVGAADASGAPLDACISQTRRSAEP
jgi:hypothetical protein